MEDYNSLKTDQVYGPALVKRTLGKTSYVNLTYKMEQVNDLHVEGITMIGGKALPEWQVYSAARDSGDTHLQAVAKIKGKAVDTACLTKAEQAKRVGSLIGKPHVAQFAEYYSGVCYGISLAWLERRSKETDFPTKTVMLKNAPSHLKSIKVATKVKRRVVPLQASQSATRIGDGYFKLKDSKRIHVNDLSKTVASLRTYTLFSSPMHAMAICRLGNFVEVLDPNHGSFLFRSRNGIGLNRLFVGLVKANGLASTITLDSLAIA